MDTDIRKSCIHLEKYSNIIIKTNRSNLDIYLFYSVDRLLRPQREYIEI